MASYHVFFRKPDPPLGTPESNELQRFRGSRNLTRKLSILLNDGDWVNALKAIRNAERGNALLHASARQYAMVVQSFLDSQSFPDSENDFMKNLHEKVVTGEVPSNPDLLLGMLTFYNSVNKPHNSLKILEFAREKGFTKEIGMKGASTLMKSAQILNRHGYWKAALDITVNQIGNQHTNKTDIIRAESHALHGDWASALTILQKVENKELSNPAKNTCGDEEAKNALRVHIAHAAALSARWDISLELIHKCSENTRKITDDSLLSIMWKTCVQNINLLHQSGHWAQALAVARIYHTKFGQSTPNQKLEILHSVTLETLLENSQWKHAIRYYMHDCEDATFESNVLRRISAKVLMAAGCSEAARRISSDVSMNSNRSTQQPQSNNRTNPSFSLLELSGIPDDTIRKMPDLPAAPQNISKVNRLHSRNPEIMPDRPLSDRWIPKAPFNRQFLTPENGFSVNFSPKAFEETAPPPPTNYYDRSSGWAYWNQSNGLGGFSKKKIRTAYNFSQTETFQKIPEYKRAWNMYKGMKNLFRR